MIPLPLLAFHDLEVTLKKTLPWNSLPPSRRIRFIKRPGWLISALSIAVEKLISWNISLLKLPLCDGLAIEMLVARIPSTMVSDCGVP